MSAEWYYGIDDRQHGPVSLKELKRLLSSGEISPSALVWNDSMPEWKPAHTVPGLCEQQQVSQQRGQDQRGGARRILPANDEPESLRDGAAQVVNAAKTMAAASAHRAHSRLHQTFGDAINQTRVQVYAAGRQLAKHPLRLSFLTIIFILASGLALGSFVGAVLFPVFVMGYITCIQATIDGEKAALEGFIGFMRHGWDSFWHLLMMLAAFFVTLAAILAPFVIFYLLLYFVLGTVGAVIGEAASHSTNETSYEHRAREHDRFNRTTYERQPRGDAEKPSKFTQWLSDVIGEIVGLGLKALLMVVAVAILAPVAASLVLFFYLVLEVSRGRPDPANRFDLVYNAFGKMLVMGGSHWKQLFMSGLSLSLLAIGTITVASLLSLLLSKMHLYVLASWLFAGLVPAAVCIFIVYTNVFVTMTCLSLGERRPAQQ